MPICDGGARSPRTLRQLHMAVWLAAAAWLTAAMAAGAQAIDLTAIDLRGVTLDELTDAQRAQLLLQVGAYGVYGIGQTTFTASTSEQLVFNTPSVTSLQTRSSQTEIVAKLIGGRALYDQMFALPFDDPAVQTGVTQARLAITTAGGPGVIILGPTLTSQTMTTSTSSVTTYSFNHAEMAVNVSTHIGDTSGLHVDKFSGQVTYNGNIIGSVGKIIYTYNPIRDSFDLTGGAITQNVVDGVPQGPPPSYYQDVTSSCAAGLASLPSTTMPVCTTGGRPVLLIGGQVGINVDNATTDFIDQAILTTTDTLTSSVYTLTGTVKPIGVVHAVAPVSAFDQGEGFAQRGFARMPGDGVRAWLAPWGSRGTTAGDRRDASGVDGGLSWRVTKHVALGVAVNTGRTNMALSDGSEWGRLDLAGIGVFARFGGDTGWGASLGAGSERGHVTTTVTVPGFSDVGQARELVTQGWAAAEVHDTLMHGRWAVIPNAGIIASRARLKGFHETGSQFDLNADAQGLHRDRAWVGVDAVWSATAKLDLTAGVKAIQFSGAVTPTRQVTFADFPDAGILTVTAPAAKKTGASVDLGADYHIGKSTTLFVSFDATARDKRTDTAIFAGFRAGF